MNKKYLIIGKGFFGNKFAEYLEDSVMSEKRIESKEDVLSEIQKYNPTVVINCAGRTGYPNVDWCEDHREETLTGNVLLPLEIAKACQEAGVKMVHLGSGCIYKGNNNGKGFSEEDRCNFGGSFYSLTKALSEQLLKDYDVLQLRIRMPVDSVPGPKNLITKLTKYDKVIDVENSITVVDDFVRIVKELIEKEKKGIYNVCNPGAIKHSEILEMYKEIVDPNFKYEMISVEELEKFTKAKRSNCVLNTKKLESEVEIKPAKERLKEIFKLYK
jgi:dTDP-4-dehydrorhamnose reductase